MAFWPASIEDSRSPVLCRAMLKTSPASASFSAPDVALRAKLAAKRREYAQTGIPRYWVVDRDAAQTVTLYMLGTDKDYEVAAERAKAEYEDALAEATAANLNVPVSRVGSSSQISGAEAELERAEAGVTVALKQVEQAQARLIDARALATSPRRLR